MAVVPSARFQPGNYFKSKYLHIVKSDEENAWLFYQLLTGQLYRLDADEKALFDDFMNLNPGSEAFESFVQRGLLVDYDELESLKTKHLRCNEEIFNLMICPTLGCNFDCIYCTETGNKREGLMTAAVMEGVFNYVERNLKSGSFKTLRMEWFGGEPLLGIHIIEKLGGRIKALCDDLKVELETRIITNGYLLNQKAVDILEAQGLDFIEITVDGPKEIHDTLRTLKGGSGTYERIIHNMENIRTRAEIRVNCILSKINKEYFREVVKIIEDIKRKTGNHIYVIAERMMLTAGSREYVRDKVIGYEEYCRLFAEGGGLSVSDMKPKKWRCTGVLKNSFSIDERGNVYKCNAFLGMDEHIVFTVFDEKIRNQKEIDYFLDRSFPGRAECLACKLLPVCMGLCPLDSENSVVCHRLKNYLDAYVRNLAREQLRKC